MGGLEAEQAKGKAQEIIFLGNLYNNPELIQNYIHILSANEVFKTEPAISIWKKTFTYYRKYAELPTDPEVMLSVFLAKELEILEAGRANAESKEVKVQFSLDSFDEGLKAIHLRNAVTKATISLDLGQGNIESTAQMLQDALVESNKISNLVKTQSALPATAYIEQWAHGELPSQKPLIEIPIIGLNQYIAGTPRGDINFMISPSGKGKTTALCNLTAGMLHNSSVLYVTLEMPAINIIFKVLANRSRGIVNPNFAFTTLEAQDSLGRPVVTADAEQSIIRFTENPNQLFILDMPAKSIQASYIANELKRLRRMFPEQEIDTVIVDYGDLLQSAQGGIADVGWQYMGMVAEELAALAKAEGVVVWTASQAGKGTGAESDSIKKFKPLRASDVWGSDGKVQTGSLALGLTVHRSTEFSAYGIGALSTLKNRFSIGNGHNGGGFFGDLIVKVDYSTATIEVLGAADGQTVWADVITTGLAEIHQKQRAKQLSKAPIQTASKADYRMQTAGIDTSKPFKSPITVPVGKPLPGRKRQGISIQDTPTDL